MEMLLILIGGNLAVIIAAKVDWKTRSIKYIIPITAAVIQTLFIVLKMLTMKLPFKL